MLSWKKHCWCKNRISVWSLFLNFVQVIIKMTRSEKATREILHFSMRVVCQLFWAAVKAESSQNCSPDGPQPIPAVLTHQHFDKVKCPSIGGHSLSLVFCPNAIERQREVTSYFRLPDSLHCWMTWNIAHTSANTEPWLTHRLLAFYIQEAFAEGWA